MRNTSIYILSSVILLVGLSACGKTTKGKIANDWKVASSEETWISEDVNEKSTRTTSISGTTFSSTYIQQQGGGPPETVNETGTVQINDFTINKNGTWSSVREITKSQANNGSYTSKMEESGTWSFIEKTKGDDFKKNERVLFNVLTANYYAVVKENGAVTSESNAVSTYLTGERSSVYTVTESKKNKLEMKMERDSKYTFGTESIHKSIQKFVLEEK